MSHGLRHLNSGYNRRRHAPRRWAWDRLIEPMGEEQRSRHTEPMHRRLSPVLWVR